MTVLSSGRAAGRLFVGAAALLVITLPLFAAKPVPPPVPPSAMIIGTVVPTGYANESFTYQTGSEVYSRPTSVPADGSWIFGNATWAGHAWMDCDHHYEGVLAPNNSAYNPLFRVGTTSIDAACFGYNCYSCSFNFGGDKGRTYLTSDTYPGFLPAGSAFVDVRSLNGGGNQSNPDIVTIWLAQVNRVDMTSMTLFQSVTRKDPSPAETTVVADRAFYAETDDRVPVVPLFHHGTESFPAGPGMTYTAKWDNNLITTPEIQPPLVVNGHSVVTVPIPKMTSGSHSFTLTAKLPGGKTWTATMSVFVFAKAVYLGLDGSFNAATPTDDLPLFVPGSDRTGASVPIKPGVPQVVTIHVLAGKGFSGNVTVELLTPSAYPGIAMNYPPDSTDVTPDADFGSASTLSATKAIPGGGAAVKDVAFPLYIRDYAASATLHVTMTYGKKTFDFRQPLPRDTDENLLPDGGWSAGATRVSTTSLTAGADRDALPAMPLAIPPDAPNGDGDNLTVFEEYRGFIVGGQHLRTNPASKDFFVDATAFAGDVQFIPILLPATSLHAIDSTEASSSGEINANTNGSVPGCGDGAPDGHHFQNMKKVVDGGIAPPIFGMPTPRFGENECYTIEGPCIPNTTGNVVIFTGDIDARATTDNITDASLILKLRRNTVAHETGHSMNLYHVTNTSCLMFGMPNAGFTAQGAWTNIPDSICSGVTATVNECIPCGPTFTIDNISNFTETDSLRLKPRF